MLPAVRNISAAYRVASVAVFLVMAGALAAPAFAQPPDSSFTYAEIWTPSPKARSIHLHGGMFTPIEVNAPSPTLGLRLCRHLGSHLQGGVLTGWTYHRKSLLQETDGLGGIEPHIVLAQIDAHLVPAMGFLQVNLTEKHWLVPYAGIGGGYEWFILEANDYRTLETAKATYSNWAWEAWLGMGMRLGRDLRLDGELFYNGAALERDVTDEFGQSWREQVDLNGAGLRVGLDIVFQ